MFALDEELARCEAALPLLSGLPRLTLLVTMAWHLRQRDSARALQLCADARPLMTELSDAAQHAINARFDLVAAEAEWLAGRLEQAQMLANGALARFADVGDNAGCADSHWLLAWIAVDHGQSALCEAELQLAAGCARAAGDPVRTDICDAAAAIFAVFGDLQTATTRWYGRFDADLSNAHPLSAGWINDYFGTAAFQASDFGRAVHYLMLTYDTALTSGQLRRAINIATNIGNAFTSLNAHDVALEWMQRGLDLARPTGWPMSVGLCLMQTAETMRHLDQHEAAQELLQEGIGLLARLSGSRAYAVALEYQGNLALDTGDHVLALSSFAMLKERGEALRQSDFQSSALRGQAHALSRLERPAEALEMAAAALTLATEHGDAYNRISALSVLAEIHSRHGDGVGSPSVPNQALHYLESALELGATIDGYTVPGSLLDAAARAYAAAGDYAKAYDIALRASAARDKTHTQEATHRSIAMQIQYQTARAQTQSEHHRQLAAAEAQRAEVLQRTSATLAHLSQIGQEITAHLHATAVFRALDRHVHGLLDATHFSIYLLETDEESELGLDGASGAADVPPRAQYLRRAFGIEDGKQLPPTRVSMADTQRNSVRCVLERREIMIDVAPDTARPNLIPGTLPTLSLLFAPLQIGDHVLGVMTVQSLLGSAYGERERLIFRTLCAYGAIALDNAHAYRQVAATLRTLNETQAQLLEKNVELEQAYRALEQVSLTDQLTGLRNRRYFLQHVEADVAMSLRHYDNSQHLPDGEASGPNKDLVFFMVDLDHFKQVNDRYGHAAGDAVLVQMQERLREVFRESDYLIRWGGEEFLALARATHRDDARLVAERIRAAVADRPFVLPDGVRLQKTCSVGFACFPFLPAQPRLLNWSQVVELADQGLYLAKNRGRNGWAGIYGTSTTMADGNFSRLLQSLEQSLRDRELELVSGPGRGDVAGEAGGALKRLG